MDTDKIRKAFISHYRDLKDEPVPPFAIQLYPYSGLRHTIRIRQGRILVRISDILSSAPEPVLSALLALLLHKLFRRKAPQQYQEIYQSYISRTPVREYIHRTRRVRGRKYLSNPEGRIHNLQAIYEELNQSYFYGRLKVRRLSWSRHKNRRLLGHYDPAHAVIVINRKLDHPCVPHYVVEYVLYHEMLHAHLGESVTGNRRCVHSGDFHRAERRFARYREAQEFIAAHL